VERQALLKKVWSENPKVRDHFGDIEEGCDQVRVQWLSSVNMSMMMDHQVLQKWELRDLLIDCTTELLIHNHVIFIFIRSVSDLVK
jgi:hypothetical protein